MKTSFQKIYIQENNLIKKSPSSSDINEAIEDAIDEIVAQYKPPKFTDSELLEIFPEAREIVPTKIKETKSDIQKKEKEIQSALKKLHSSGADDFSIWFGKEVIKMLMMPDLLTLDKRLLKLKRFKHLLNPERKYSNYFEFGEKIEIAKKYSVAELARDKLELKPSGKNFVALCPYHEERTPSFYLYTETNTFVCFGCGEKGSIIKSEHPRQRRWLDECCRLKGDRPSSRV